MVEMISGGTSESVRISRRKMVMVLDAINHMIEENEDEKEMYLYGHLCDDLGDEARENEQETKQSHSLKKIYGQFERYMFQVPFIGFNSAKYDLNLIKRTLAKHLRMHDTEQKEQSLCLHCHRITKISVPFSCPWVIVCWVLQGFPR